jgi:hypothetical protein
MDDQITNWDEEKHVPPLYETPYNRKRKTIWEEKTLK